MKQVSTVCGKTDKDTGRQVVIVCMQLRVVEKMQWSTVCGCSPPAQTMRQTLLHLQGWPSLCLQCCICSGFVSATSHLAGPVQVPSLPLQLFAYCLQLSTKRGNSHDPIALYLADALQVPGLLLQLLAYCLQLSDRRRALGVLPLGRGIGLGQLLLCSLHSKD